MTEDYEEKKSRLIKAFVEKINKEGTVGLGKSTSNLFRERQKNTSKVNVRDFNTVISIDVKNMIAEVEGMTTFEDLVKETLKYGFLPPVVPELKLITIGGAVSGVGIESSSFKYGLVHETVLEMEILLASGETVIATREKHSDLFFAIPNSYGTLGYILKLKIQIVPTKKYVEIKHVKYTDQKKYFEELTQLSNNKTYDFIDGVIFKEDDMYIILGKFVDTAPFVSDYKYMKIYFKSITDGGIDYLTASDYIWRWDTDWFWCSNNFFMQNAILRLFLGKFMLGSRSFMKVKRFYEKHLEKYIGRKNSESIVQDIAIPIENCIPFLNFFHTTIGIKPIWICPVHSYKKENFTLFPVDPMKFYVDIAFWDAIKSDKEKGYYNRLIEEETKKLGGLKSLYSQSFYSELEFWEIYNGEEYKKLKNTYDPKYVLKDMYRKCVLRK